ncbi:MAG: UPF0149 family protein [Pseudomonadaceae bacterium]|nr:UPF0149 family protein [Pseudomonadaceae bacterium]
MSDLQALAQNASSIIDPPELHGVVCGFAAGEPAQFMLSEFVQLMGTDVLSDETAVSDFVSAALEGLFAQDMSFVPLIPDDEYPLEQRLAGLSAWCAGFLSGFGAAFGGSEGGATMDTLPLDVQEILRDFASISSLDESVEGGEHEESAYMEIYEYVRVAAVLALTLISEQAERTAANKDDSQDSP